LVDFIFSHDTRHILTGYLHGHFKKKKKSSYLCFAFQNAPHPQRLLHSIIAAPSNILQKISSKDPLYYLGGDPQYGELPFLEVVPSSNYGLFPAEHS
jgi:hypothetical protein